MKITSATYGNLPDGKTANLFTITNDNQITFEITNYGGIVTKLLMPDKKGNIDDIIIGFDNLKGFLEDTSYINALIGRFGNRIGNAQFEIDNKLYKLAANNGSNHLHGGIKGFHKVLWKAEPVEKPGEAGVKLTYLSTHMEEGYPGNLHVEVIITLNNENELKLDYKAKTDATTHVNLTHHGYFNLNGGKRDILDHKLKLYASRYTECDASLIPTGRVLPVKGTDFDFTSFREIGLNIERTGGYDINFVLDKKDRELAIAAEVYEPESGRVMEVYTTQPGVQLYTSNHFDGSVQGKGGKKHIKHFAFCLETQHFPDSPNRPAFPSTLLKPGEIYNHITIYKLLVK
jgi:aldose 1-epimerase